MLVPVKNMLDKKKVQKYKEVLMHVWINLYKGQGGYYPQQLGSNLDFTNKVALIFHRRLYKEMTIFKSQ